jgi:uncharacterized protein (DUF2141 family)
MKVFIKYGLFICLACCVGQRLYSQTYNLCITIPNIKNTEGKIQIGLYNTKESFPLIDKQYMLFSVATNGFTGIYTINNLPKGEYALAIFHDQNADKICNTNFLGIPKEGYGFSRNYKPILSSPSFDACKIALLSDMAITIELIYK